MILCCDFTHALFGMFLCINLNVKPEHGNNRDVVFDLDLVLGSVFVMHVQNCLVALGMRSGCFHKPVFQKSQN